MGTGTNLIPPSWQIGLLGHGPGTAATLPIDPLAGIDPNTLALWEAVFGRGGGGGRPPPPGGPPDLGEDIQVVELPGGKRIYATPLKDLTGDWAGEWDIIATEDPSEGGGGFRGPTAVEVALAREELALRFRGLEEEIRANKAQEQLTAASLAETIRSALVGEQEARNRRALDAAASALTGYLRAAELADARRLAAFQEGRQLLPYVVDPSDQFFGGGPQGALATVLGQYGLPYTPSPIQHTQLNPAALAQGAFGQEILDQIAAVTAGGTSGT